MTIYKKKLSLLTSFFMLAFFFQCYAQKGKYIYTITPNWNINNAKMIKKHGIINDSTYYYKKAKNNLDSSLIMVQYFDSLGNLSERDEFSFNTGEVWKITNYTYNDTLLIQRETASKNMFIINNDVITKSKQTYLYDSVGNMIIEKEFRFNKDSTERVAGIWRRQYDNNRHLIKLFDSSQDLKGFLHYEYFYTNDLLTEVKAYDLKHNWIYSYVHEYDNTLRMESIYLNNDRMRLQNEFYYDAESLAS